MINLEIMELKPVINFLSDLYQNNSSLWMLENKARYLQAKQMFESFVSELIQQISVFDKSMINVAPKDCIFRLNRDTRFSKDKRPYKDFFSAHIALGGRRSFTGGYYIQIHHDDKTLIGGGIHTPSKEILQNIRKEILSNGDKLNRLLCNPKFKSTFNSFTGDKLKRVPKGYPQEHPYIELIKMKNFDIEYKYDKERVQSEYFINDILQKFQIMKPVSDFLNKIVLDSLNNNKVTKT